MLRAQVVCLIRRGGEIPTSLHVLAPLSRGAGPAPALWVGVAFLSARLRLVSRGWEEGKGMSHGLRWFSTAWTQIMFLCWVKGVSTVRFSVVERFYPRAVFRRVATPCGSFNEQVLMTRYMQHKFIAREGLEILFPGYSAVSALAPCL